MTVLLVALVNVEEGAKLIAIQMPMAVDQIHVGAHGSLASSGCELALLLP